MKILFVSSGNKKFEDSPIVASQAESLRRVGVDVDHFFILGKGFYGYLRNIFKLNNYLKKNKYDLIHAHYSLSGFVALFASNQPLIVSLMGSDVHSKGMMKIVILWLIKYSKTTIVKSEGMKVNKYFQKAVIIPNGVDIDVFKPIDKKEAQKQVGFKSKKNIVFIGNPSRREKNSRLAFDAFDLLEGSNLELNVVSGVQFKDIPYYYNAADLLLLTSLWEGSPNVIKEAMACNCPVVATDVGDVAWVMGNEPGYYLATFDPEDVAKKVLLALQYSESHGRTNGRQRIIKLGLDAETTAKRLISVYQATLQ